MGRPDKPNLSVPLLDLEAQYRTLEPDIEAAIRRVCKSRRFILGREVQQLEQEIAAYCGAGHAVGMSSGTDALLAALMALGIGGGNAVVTSPYTFFATAGSIARAGARPVFCDIEPDSYNLDPDAVRRYLEGSCRQAGGATVDAKTGAVVKAIVPVHLFGRMADMRAIGEVAAEFGLRLIEDAAQAIGAETPDGRRAGSIGDIGCLSFYPSKNLGAFGDAGLCVTQAPDLARSLRALRVHGAGAGGRHAVIGGNFRLDEIQAAVLNVALARLDGWTGRRQALARRYAGALRGMPLRLPAPPAGRDVCNQYVVETDAREELRAWLRERDVATAVYYPVPLHRQPCFRHLGHRAGDFPAAEAAAARSLALPIFPGLTEAQQDHVIDSVAGFFEHRA